MDKGFPPDWAIERALKLGNEEKYSPHFYGNSDAALTLDRVKEHPQHGNVFRITAFARYIAEKEFPPVDPDLLIAREICASRQIYGSTKSAFLEGRLDHSDDLSKVMYVIRIYKERNGL